MKKRPRPVAIFSCFLALSLIIAQGSSHQAELVHNTSIVLPPQVMLDERSLPVLSSNGKFGFISSVTDGSVISFNAATGKIVSSIVVGETAGPVSMVELEGRRLLAVPSSNDPKQGRPATVSLIEAVNSRRLDLVSFVTLPGTVHLTNATRALLTSDGRYGVIASSFEEPTLFSFETQTGQILSRLPLIGRPSDVALFDAKNGGRRLVAVTSAAANLLTVIRIDGEGGLDIESVFSPPAGSFEEANNPVFSSDGTTIFAAAAQGERLFAVDAASGALMSNIRVSPSPQRVSLGRSSDGFDVVAVTRVRNSSNGAPAGVTVLASSGGRLVRKAEFNPPDQIEFSRSNNVAFTAGANVAFVGSATGILFAFDVETGNLQSHSSIGSELMGIAADSTSNLVTVVRRGTAGDEIVVVSFEVVAPNEEKDEGLPVIDSLNPETVEQDRHLNLTVKGQNFVEGSKILVAPQNKPVNELAAELQRGGRVLMTRVPRATLSHAGNVAISVRRPDGAVSNSKILAVTPINRPVIEKLAPSEVPGPAGPFAIRVAGKNFRRNSIISVGNQPLTTEFISPTKLQAVVPKKLAKTVGSHDVVVLDDAALDRPSNAKTLAIFGPRVQSVQTVGDVLAGASFTLKITGSNFREGAAVLVNRSAVPNSRVSRLSRTFMRLTGPGRMISSAGTVSVVVRNPEGSESTPVQIDAKAPSITAVEPGSVLAGVRDARVDIRGASFRKLASVTVGGTEVRHRIKQSQIRFRSSTRITIRLSGSLNDLIAQPGTVMFEVINPNNADGVRSAPVTLSVLGPSILGTGIEPVEDDETTFKVVIKGANFRKGAEVEFIREGQVIRRRPASNVTRSKVAVLISEKKLEGLGSVFQVRVVNPGEVRSAAFKLERTPEN